MGCQTGADQSSEVGEVISNFDVSRGVVEGCLACSGRIAFGKAEQREVSRSRFPCTDQGPNLGCLWGPGKAQELVKCMGGKE